MREIDDSLDFTETNMKKMIAALAFAIALPTVASAQAPQPAAKPGCCAGMKEMCACCKGMSGAGHQKGGSGHSDHGQSGHAGHDAPQQDSKTAPADSHHNHQR